jgi:hypothetical protein
VERLPAEFEFARPINNGAYIPLDGNLPANRIENIGGEYTLENAIPPGGTLYILWFDFESDATSDHYLAIDDVVITLPGTN